jgi:hypothetical protein
MLALNPGDQIGCEGLVQAAHDGQIVRLRVDGLARS